jgi:hypothetical protein
MLVLNMKEYKLRFKNYRDRDDVQKNVVSLPRLLFLFNRYMFRSS